MNQNPYVTVDSPNYAVPLLDLFGQNKQPQGQRQGQPQQGQPPQGPQQQGQQPQQQPGFLQQLIARFGPQLGIGSSPTMSGNPGGLFSGVNGAPGYYGGPAESNPMLRPMA